MCFDLFKEPTIAKCGHTFCKGCIEEVVSRQHSCPVCKKDLQAVDLSRNFQLEDLIKALLAAQEREKTKFFEKIVEKVEEPMKGIEFGPIQSVFQKNLKQSLLAY